MIEFEIVNSAQKTKIGGSENEKSIAGILSYKAPSTDSGQVRIFMAGDITADVEKRLVWQRILKESVNVLKVNHHGSKEASSEELLEILKPKLAVISIGAKNKFGHSTKEILERLKKWGVEILRTDEKGGIIYSL